MVGAVPERSVQFSGEGWRRSRERLGGTQARFPGGAERGVCAAGRKLAQLPEEGWRSSRERSGAEIAQVMGRDSTQFPGEIRPPSVHHPSTIRPPSVHQKRPRGSAAPSKESAVPGRDPSNIRPPSIHWALSMLAIMQWACNAMNID